MKLSLFQISLVCIFISCSTSGNFRKDKQAFESSKVIMSFKSVADLNDSYFDIKDNNYFEFYRLLYDSIKNTRYPGRYSKKGDTLLLSFYNKKGYSLLGHKAMIDRNNKEIVFFDNYPGYRKRLFIN